MLSTHRAPGSSGGVEEDTGERQALSDNADEDGDDDDDDDNDDDVWFRANAPEPHLTGFEQRTGQTLVPKGVGRNSPQHGLSTPIPSWQGPIPEYSPGRYPDHSVTYAMDHRRGNRSSRHGGPHAKSNDIHSQQPMPGVWDRATYHYDGWPGQFYPPFMSFYSQPPPSATTENPEWARLRIEINELKAEREAERRARVQGEQELRQEFESQNRQLEGKARQFERDLQEHSRSMERARLQGEQDVLEAVEKERREEKGKGKQQAKQTAKISSGVNIAEPDARKRQSQGLSSQAMESMVERPADAPAHPREQLPRCSKMGKDDIREVVIDLPSDAVQVRLRIPPSSSKSPEAIYYYGSVDEEPPHGSVASENVNTRGERHRSENLYHVSPPILFTFLVIFILLYIMK